ncbi:UPF0280 family protein [Chloroflexota bacterium]
MESRTYRHWVDSKDLTTFNITIRETDLHISAASNLKSEAIRISNKYRSLLEKYIERHHAFLTSLEPLPDNDNAPRIVKQMLTAAQKTGVGPMASVAGAIAEFVGNELLAFSPEIIVENGGDIYLKSRRNRIVGIYAGDSSLSGKIGLEIEGQDSPLGICTSSGTVGHSLSYGKADAVIALSHSATIADAAATAIGNSVSQPADISSGIEFSKRIDGLRGVVIIIADNIGLWGEIKLCHTTV